MVALIDNWVSSPLSISSQSPLCTVAHALFLWKHFFGLSFKVLFFRCRGSFFFMQNNLLFSVSKYNGNWCFYFRQFGIFYERPEINDKFLYHISILLGAKSVYENKWFFYANVNIKQRCHNKKRVWLKGKKSL